MVINSLNLTFLKKVIDPKNSEKKEYLSNLKISINSPHLNETSLVQPQKGI